MKRQLLNLDTLRDRSTYRRGVVIVITMMMMLVLLGFAALTVDVGATYATRAELQRAADAGALAAADVLAGAVGDSAVELAVNAAKSVVERNPVMGRKITLAADEDVTVGRAEFNPETGSYDFTPTTVLADAVRVRVRQTADSPNGAAPLYFGTVFGKTGVDVSAEAIAYLGPRDIAVVVDTSGSLNDDSELRHYKLTEVNLYDVWAALPQHQAVGIGGEPPAGLPEELGGAPGGLDGPAWGYMSELGWGADLDPDAYSPSADSGLIRLAYGQSWSDAELSSYLSRAGYSVSEVQAIMSSAYDNSGAYDERVAVAMGLAVWNSGISGGLWETRGVLVAETGNGNAAIGASELVWIEPIFDLTVSESRDVWRDYIGSYMTSSRTAMAQADSGFRYGYGIKTFINYLLEKREGHEATPELANTPAQPTQAVKDAVGFMVGLLDGLNTSDQMSLVIYATTSKLEVPLTSDFRKVSDRLNEMQAGYYDVYTNMGGGLAEAIDEVTGERARGMSRKVIVMLTDGIANVDADGRYDGSGDGGSSYALDLARKAADAGIKIFTVSVGAAADQDLMERLAELGNGVHFHAEGTIEEYSHGLAEIFTTIGTSRAPELIK